MSDTIAPLCLGRCGLQIDDDVRPWLAIVCQTGRGPRTAVVCPDCEASGMHLELVQRQRGADTAGVKPPK